MSETFEPAKRGDIAVMTSYKRGYSLVAGNFSSMRITVGIVTAVTRDGRVKKVLPAGITAAPMTPRDWQELAMIRDHQLADKAGFLAECEARQTPDPETYAPFEDLNDVRQLARKYRA